MNKDFKTYVHYFFSKIQITVKVETKELQTQFPKAAYNYPTPK